MVLLRKLRQEKGLSMNKLASLVGISCCVINNIENKQYKSASNNMKKLADYFEVENPLDLINSAETTIKSKKCLNQVCLLNKNCYCQSIKVIEGADCRNQNEVSSKVKDISFNNTNALFLK